MLRFASALGVAAIGQTIVMITGEFDLSVGSTMTFVAVISADIMDSTNEHILFVLLTGFGVALVVGLINGLVTRGGFVSFIVTLAMKIGLEGTVRQGPLKLIEFYENGRLELYNLEEDISEQYNLAEEMPNKTRELHLQLKQCRQDIDARMPTPNPQCQTGTVVIWK